MDDRFKIELYPEQLELIIDALTVAQWDCPTEIKVKYKAVQDYLEPEMKAQSDFKRAFKK
jgi:hypothetical protein